MKKIKYLLGSLCILTLLSCVNTEANAQQVDPISPNSAEGTAKIRMAILFDTSNSMDGLIEKAKSQIWDLLNRVAEFKKEGKETVIEVALYHYGNSSLPGSEGYIQMLSPFTSDMDEISRLLFAMRTNGGEEYCGTVINRSMQELSWLSNQQDLEVVFIAGNESFNQGSIAPSKSCAIAQEKGVFVNTIFCGDYNTGLNLAWKSGADMTNGAYANIDHNQATHYVASPFDDSIRIYNIQLNNTYIYYGQAGRVKAENMKKQDQNSQGVSAANQAKRAKYKSSSMYKNDSWDLVDKLSESNDESEALAEVAPSSLPEEYQNLSKEELAIEVKEKAAERTKIQTKIQELSIKREDFVRKQNGGEDNEFVTNMISALKKQAALRGFKV